MSIEAINRRLDFIDIFYKDVQFVENMRSTLKGFPDVERGLTNLLLRPMADGARNLIIVKKAISTAASSKQLIHSQLEKIRQQDGRKNILSLNQVIILESCLERLGSFDDLNRIISSTIVDSPSSRLTDGDFIREE